MVGTGGLTDAEIEELEALGADADFIAERKKKAASDGALLLHPDNVDAFRLFTQCQTQWRRSPSGAITGLDYAGVKTAAELEGVSMTPALFEQIRVMEKTVLEVVNEQR